MAIVVSDMKFPRPLPIAVVGIILALAIAGFSALSGFQAEEQNREQAVLSTNVLNDLRRIEASLLDAETGQRGFILTGDQQYLEPYERGTESFPEALATLRERLAGIETGRQLAALDRLEDLGNDKLAELAETISLFNAGDRDASLALISSNLGQHLMTEVRSLVDELEDEEQVILSTAINSAQSVQTRTASFLAFSSGMILVLIGMLAYTFVRSERLNRTEELLEEVTLHRDRTMTLAQELSHRTKNLFGIVNSIVRMTGRSETDAKVAIKKISERINALSRAHSLTATGEPDDEVGLEELVQLTLQPYEAEDKQFSLSGENVKIESGNITPLGLILHELATNAVKYGAWSEGMHGSIDISWESKSPEGRQQARKVDFVWRESCGELQSPPDGTTGGTDHTSSGFGSRMIETSVQQLKGTIDRRWDCGMVVKITFEL